MMRDRSRVRCLRQARAAFLVLLLVGFSGALLPASAVIGPCTRGFWLHPESPFHVGAGAFDVAAGM